MADKFDDYAEAGEGGLDLRSLLLFGVLRSRWLVMACTVLGLLGGLGYALMLPNEFVSSMQVLFQPGAREASTFESVMMADGSKGNIVNSPVRTEIRILDQPSVHRRVAVEVGPERLLSGYDPAALDGPNTRFHSRIQHRLQSWWFDHNDPTVDPGFDPTNQRAIIAAAAVVDKHVVLRNSPDSNLIDFLATTHDSVLSQDLCTAFVRISQERHKEVYPTRTNPLEDRIKGAWSELLDSREKYKTHRTQCGFIDIDQSSSNLHHEISELDGEIRRVTLLLKDIPRRLKTIDEQLASEPATTNSWIVPEPVSNPQYVATLDRQRALFDNLIEIKMTLREGSRDREARERVLGVELAEIEQELNSLEPLKVHGQARMGTVPNPIVPLLSINRAELEQEYGGLSEQLGALKEERLSKNGRMQAVLACEDQHADMETLIAADQKTFDGLNEALNDQRKLALIEERDVSSLRVLQKAELPSNKAGPDRLEFLILGLLGGLAAGLGLAILRQVLDGSLRYPADLERVLGVPLIGVVPEERRWKERGRELRRTTMENPA